MKSAVSRRVLRRWSGDLGKVDLPRRGRLQAPGSALYTVPPSDSTRSRVATRSIWFAGRFQRSPNGSVLLPSFFVRPRSFARYWP